MTTFNTTLGGNGHCYVGIPIFGPAFSPFLLPISYIGPAINLWCPRKLEVVHSLVLLGPLCEQFWGHKEIFSVIMSILGAFLAKFFAQIWDFKAHNGTWEGCGIVWDSIPVSCHHRGPTWTPLGPLGARNPQNTTQNEHFWAISGQIFARFGILKSTMEPGRAVA